MEANRDQTAVEQPSRLWRAFRIIGVNVLAFLAFGVYGEVSIVLANSGNRVLEIIGFALFLALFIVLGIPLMIVARHFVD